LDPRNVARRDVPLFRPIELAHNSARGSITPGERVALCEAGQSLSAAFGKDYRLSHRSNRSASSGRSALQLDEDQCGIEPGDRVMLFGPNCWEWLVSYYGIVKTGAVVNPINAMLTPEEVRYAVTDSGARFAIAAADKGAALLDMAGIGNLSEVVLWGDAPITGAVMLSEWLRLGKTDFTTARRKPTDLAAICYTSGTTGFPKGTMQSHRAVVGSAVGTALMAARTAHDRVINALPLSHVYGSCVFNAAMISGSTLILIPRFNELTVLGAVAEHRATLMDGVPTAYYYLLAHADFDKYDLTSLTRCWVGGQTLPAAKSLEFTGRTGCPVHEAWGMTELAGAATANPVYGHNKPGTIGIPFPGNSFRVVDVEDADREVARGERGELMYRGPLVMDGYYNNPKSTAETLSGCPAADVRLSRLGLVGRSSRSASAYPT
jgi:long-chain acyl-CoA synthetase